mmetsp:Transcript_21188/g.29482  ORF Transcript_21188/g.29482 Transcript_21188/m.29482 type:complete len:249 (+) Transcript_21188:1617-2363(+)
MDSHISEDSSTTFHVFKGRRRRVTRTKLDHNVFTDFFRFNSIPNTTEVIIKTSLKTNHEFNTGLVTGIDGLNGFGQIGSNRLFTKYMFVVCSACLDLFGMKLRWRTNPDSVNFGISDDIHGISTEASYIEVSSGFLSLGDSGVGYNHRLDIRSLVDSSKMDKTNATTSDHTNFDLLGRSIFLSCHSQSRRRLGTRSDISECKSRGGRHGHQGNKKSCKLHLEILYVTVCCEDTPKTTRKISLTPLKTK